MTRKTIDVAYLARVEGEGAFEVELEDGKVSHAHLKIFEPPRFFEALLRGRFFAEAPDITARICGICPVAYQMSSVHAMENLCGVTVDGQLRALRRLIYCGEWIESHVLHVYMLHAPDFLGYPDAITLAKDYPDVVKCGLQLKKIGNEIMTLLGGREIHPINVRVGGFYRVPSRSELAPLAERLKWAQEAALETVRWVATLPFPDVERDYELVALRHPLEYPLNEGHIVSSRGIDISAEEYENTFVEEHVARSTALHSVIRERGSYIVGPLARYGLNADRLSPLARQAAREAGLGPVCRNPFQSIIVRAVETVFACEEALRIIDEYEPPDRPSVDVIPRAGTGYACTEAPRGILYHRYAIDDDGTILTAKIVPPTSQNLRGIEGDLAQIVEENVHRARADLTHLCEQSIRNYDPCISCSTHFLRLELTEK
jgi:coenzyme F420-reducing hydrogenase alpha subunit